ncbi:MAG: hypothetical protein ACJAWV_003302 [Flammeovirgaceae bacterium]|jgi:hypothetical protein
MHYEYFLKTSVQVNKKKFGSAILVLMEIIFTLYAGLWTKRG